VALVPVDTTLVTPIAIFVFFKISLTVSFVGLLRVSFKSVIPILELRATVFEASGSVL